ncbi:MAG: DUF3043 domain-containing protein [Bifidobacteriaceae bacterium]|jgi:hypothetical protein|nr:DUF3043 domain-containing protein [Bifidobacteriaceae bacterium]
MQIIKNPFSKKESDKQVVEIEDVQEVNPNKKGKVTPKRSEQEKKKNRTIVSKTRKEAYKYAREQDKMKRERQYNSKTSREESDVAEKDKGPVKRYIRDYIDAKTSVAELFLPVAGVLLIASFFAMQSYPTLYYYATVTVWAFVLVALGDFAFTWVKLYKKLVDKFGIDKVKEKPTNRFIMMYALARSTQIRRMRIPKPYYPKRGTFPE